jgi:uncharacterized protein HemX
MEKPSLIKYYWALLLVLVLLAGSNHGVAQASSPTPSPTAKSSATVSPATKQSGEKSIAEAGDGMWVLVISILALGASGGAIALSILKNREINRTIDSFKKKYNDELKTLEHKYTELLNSQVNSQTNQQQAAISRNSPASSSNPYLESSIESLSERISKLENKLQPLRSTAHFRA